MKDWIERLKRKTGMKDWNERLMKDWNERLMKDWNERLMKGIPGNNIQKVENNYSEIS